MFRGTSLTSSARTVFCSEMICPVKILSASDSQVITYGVLSEISLMTAFCSVARQNLCENFGFEKWVRGLSSRLVGRACDFRTDSSRSQ